MSRAVVEIFCHFDPYTCNPPKSCIIGTLLAHSILLFYNDRKILWEYSSLKEHQNQNKQEGLKWQL